jgi:DNA-binding IclR family transcriptional regulator
MLRHPHASAAGKLMLAELGDLGSTIQKWPLKKLTQHTITDRDGLEKEIAEIRLRGEASEINELEEGSATLALPVRLPKGPLAAALCLTGPAERFEAIYERAGTARELTSGLAPLLF